MNQKLLKSFLSLLKELESGEVVLCSKQEDKRFPQPVKMFCDIQDKNLIFNNVKDENIPVLKINDLEIFMKYYEELIEIRSSFYHKLETHFSKQTHQKIMMYTIFSSMTENDFENPLKFIKDRIKAYQNPLLPNGKTIPIATTIINGNMENLNIRRIKTNPNCETPYAYQLILNDYYFPFVYADVVDNRLIVRAIQRFKGFNEEKNAKIIERYFKDYLPKTKDKSLRNITPSFVLALDLFLESAKKLTNGKIDYLEIPTYCPILSKTRENIIKNSEVIDDINYRTTNKLLYTALRMEDYKEEYEVVDYGDIGSYLKIKINHKEKIRELEPYQEPKKR